MWIKKQLVLIPTEKESQLWSNKGRNLYFNQNNPNDKDDEIRYNVYIISDDKPNINEWYIDDTNAIRQSVTPDKDYWEVRQDYKKIIACNDKSLTIQKSATGYTEDRQRTFYSNETLLQIPQSFLELLPSLYKGNDIIDVEIEYGFTINKAMGHFGQYREYFLKLDANNEISIRPIELEKGITITDKSKMYTEKEVVALFSKYQYDWAQFILNNPKSEDRPMPVKWIKNNLK